MADRITRALSDFQYWCAWPMGIELWKCHKRWADEIQAVLESTDKDGILILAPPASGKTSSLCIPLLLWTLARNQNHRSIICSGKDEYAEQIGRAAARRIVRQEELQRQFNLWPGDKWSDKEYVIQRPNWKLKDASILPIGAGSEVLSQRSDLNLCDDIATKRNSHTPAQRESLKQFFWTDYNSRLDEHGKTVMFGHRVAADDLYQDIMDQEDFVVLTEKSIISDERKEILVPEKTTYEKLCKKRERDPVGFAMFEMQHPIEFGIYCTRAQMEALKDRSRPFYNNLTDEVRANYETISFSCDPAFSTNKHSKYTVIQLWGHTPGQRRDLLYGFRGFTGPEQLLEILQAKIRIYRPNKVFIEGNAAQVLLIVPLRREFPHIATDINPVFTTNPKGQLDVDLGKLLELPAKGNSIITLPYGDAPAQAFVDNMIEEVLAAGTSRYTDTLMAWYINEKGMGNLKDNERRCHFPPGGVVGAVARIGRGRFHEGLQRMPDRFGNL